VMVALHGLREYRVDGRVQAGGGKLRRSWSRLSDQSGLSIIVR
jgi:hypothetical protein